MSPTMHQTAPLRRHTWKIALVAIAVACARHDATDGARDVTTTTAAELPIEPSPLGHGADPRPISTTMVTATRDVAGEALAIAQALCDRKLACDEVGANRPYVTRDDCLAAAEREAKRDRETMGCPNGISERRLATCLDALRSESCSPVLDVSESTEACHADALCIR